MRFKNSNQRKAVMAKLNYSQLRNRGIRLKPYSDTDKDGVKNYKDCKPLNPKEQGLIHDIIKKKQQYVKAKEKKLEQQQDELLKKIDSEKTTLNKHLQVQKQINDNKKLKQELSELKKANFYQTTTGRIIAGTKKAATSKTTKKFFKKIFT